MRESSRSFTVAQCEFMGKLQVGFGTVVLHYFSGLVNTVLHELGVGDDMFNPVSYSSSSLYIILYMYLSLEFSCAPSRR